MKELTPRPIMCLDSFFGGAASPYISALGGYEWAAAQPFALYPGQETTIRTEKDGAWTRAINMLRRRETAELPPRI